MSDERKKGERRPKKKQKKMKKMQKILAPKTRVVFPHASDNREREERIEKKQR